MDENQIAISILEYLENTNKYITYNELIKWCIQKGYSNFLELENQSIILKDLYNEQMKKFQ